MATDNRAAAEQQVKQYYDKYFGRTPSGSELAEWSDRVMKGENVSVKIANLASPPPKAMSTMPTMPATTAPFADTSNRYPTMPQTAPQGLGKAAAKNLDAKYKWLEKVPEYNKLSTADKQQVVDAVKKLSPRQQSQMAAQYGAYIGVFKPYNEW